jgi:hypothetical protein
MRYKEIFEDVQKVEDEQPETGRYDPQADAVSHLDLEDTRKPKLTLRMINRLKKIRSTKNLEMSKKQELLGIMYGVGGGDEEEI